MAERNSSDDPRNRLSGKKYRGHQSELCHRSDSLENTNRAEKAKEQEWRARDGRELGSKWNKPRPPMPNQRLSTVVVGTKPSYHVILPMGRGYRNLT